jgi:hypothetical protein
VVGQDPAWPIFRSDAPAERRFSPLAERETAKLLHSDANMQS